jgi:hypothetical protein
MIRSCGGEGLAVQVGVQCHCEGLVDGVIGLEIPIQRRECVYAMSFGFSSRAIQWCLRNLWRCCI